MTDGLEYRNKGFRPATKTCQHLEHTLGIYGLWLVGSSRDYFDNYEDENFTGIKYWNSCGSGIIAIKKK
jgi:hypothetical protein